MTVYTSLIGTWSGMKIDKGNWTQSCTYCQQAKIQRHNMSLVSTFATPEARFLQVHLDLVGSLPPSHGHIYEVWVLGCNMFIFIADDIPRKPCGPYGANLFNRYLPKNMNELGLKNIFKPFGHIFSVCIYRDATLGKSREFGK